MFADTLLQIDLPRDAAPARERPRMDLGAGRRTGVSLCPGPDVLPEQALAAACDAVAEHRMPVNLPVPGRLEALPARAASVLAQARLAPYQIEFVVDAAAVASCAVETVLALSALRDLGYGVALGGVGSAQLRLLERLPLTAVILDPGLVDAVPGSQSALSDIQAVATAARALGLLVVAPGVDTEAKRAVLAGLGCDEGEGELFGRL